jgi:hypothetical protein
LTHAQGTQTPNNTMAAWNPGAVCKQKKDMPSNELWYVCDAYIPHQLIYVDQFEYYRWLKLKYLFFLPSFLPSLLCLVLMLV